ncbi:tRNA preQ1(34) S-adenosylmethionine ribosyltransferase-isomerase QueA [Filifactor villosus]|uniref:S-adenosylmethionine:tRNA ribosyltransferase-isomerase n=1 Tax=Filifactor villosus TaxID=29374 RepID=A0ABV9QLB4_9FIRM
MNTKDFYYYLPEERIAQEPLAKRDDSKLLIVDKKRGDLEHSSFSEIKHRLRSGDVLVLNNTRVIPARLFGTKKETGASIEFLLLKRLDMKKWEVMCKPAKRLKEGTIVDFHSTLSAKVLEIKDEGIRIVEFIYKGVFEEILDDLGTMPLPPYIHKKLEDKERYQTVYSKVEGSCAAPTAGLHFTPELLEKLGEEGVQIEYVTLHVGLGTFRPVMVEDIENHRMHSEYYRIDEDVAERINRAKEEGRRIICVGTTSVRTLESAAENERLTKLEGWTDIFIYPPYTFQMAEGLITNFHLPESTLLMLVSAFCDKEKILNAYQRAIEAEYRFFSFGDAMLLI